jgi:hypothetical protein
MTDVEVVTLAVAVIVPLSLLIYSNIRIADVRLSLDSKLNDTKETLEMDRRLTALESKG